jgi:hypothetical protein
MPGMESSVRRATSATIPPVGAPVYVALRTDRFPVTARPGCSTPCRQAAEGRRAEAPLPPCPRRAKREVDLHRRVANWSTCARAAGEAVRPGACQCGRSWQLGGGRGRPRCASTTFATRRWRCGSPPAPLPGGRRAGRHTSTSFVLDRYATCSPSRMRCSATAWTSYSCPRRNNDGTRLPRDPIRAPEPDGSMRPELLRCGSGGEGI